MARLRHIEDLRLHPFSTDQRLRQTHPGWKRRGPEPLGPAAPERFPAGAGDAGELSPGPGGHRGGCHVGRNALFFSFFFKFPQKVGSL